MIRVVLLAAGIALSAGLAEAESVRVLSGEHKDFSRIVLVFGNPIGWTEGKTPEGFEVRFDRTDIAPDLSRVFEKIPKDRIRDVIFTPLLENNKTEKIVDEEEEAERMRQAEYKHRYVDGAKLPPKTQKEIDDILDTKYVFSAFNILLYAQNHILKLASSPDEEGLVKGDE